MRALPDWRGLREREACCVACDPAACDPAACDLDASSAAGSAFSVSSSSMLMIWGGTLPTACRILLRRSVRDKEVENFKLDE